MADLDEAIDVGGQAVAATPHDHPNLAGRLSNLGAALRARFLRTGRLVDLDEAVEVGRRAVASAPADDDSLPVYLANLGLALQYRFERSADVRDLDDAIDINEHAVRATPDGHLYRPMYLSNLCDAFRARSEREGRRSDLDQAISIGRLAVTATPENHPSLAWRLSNLAGALQNRFLRDKNQTDLDEAVDAGRRAAAITPPDHPNRAAVLYTCGRTLLTQFQHTHEADLRRSAMSAFREGAETGSASPRLRATCGVSWAQIAAGTGGHDEAAIAWDLVYQQLPLLTDHQLGRTDRQHHLSLVEGASSEAAFTALRLDNTVRAWQILEQGRGILLGQALEMRTDVAALRAVNPELAYAVDVVRHVLNDDTTATEDRDLAADTSSIGDVWAATISRRRRAAQDWFGLVDEIREVAGFERFALPPTLDELRQATSGGAVIAVNVASHGCDALILTTARVEHVPLPGLNRDEASQRADRLMTAATGQPDQNAFVDTMAWLWDAVAQPVLARLGHAEPKHPDSPQPRVWWIPTGPLTVLPIHAAGRNNDAPFPATVLDWVVSSYTPTVRALHHARRQPTRMDHASLTVGINTASGQVPLRGAVEEAKLAARYLGGSPLLDSDATQLAVIAALPSVSLAHFACHAVRAADPADSHLLVADGPIRVRDLAALNLEKAHVAYLSACTTGVGGAQLMDESIHIASAFQMAGFRHVIATLWPVPDRVALQYAKRIYQRFADSISPASSVHETVLEMRQRYAGHPLAWASHVHFGP